MLKSSVSKMLPGACNRGVWVGGCVCVCVCVSVYVCVCLCVCVGTSSSRESGLILKSRAGFKGVLEASELQVCTENQGSVGKKAMSQRQA